LELEGFFTGGLTYVLLTRCRNSPEQNALQKNRKKLLRWLENGRNMDAVGLNVYFTNQIRKFFISL